MENLSIILPAYDEPFLNKTLESLIEATSEGTEILPIIDGYDPGELTSHPRVRPIINEKNLGMRGSINRGIEESNGEYVMKMDAHCWACEDFDKRMLEYAGKDHLLVPRKRSLDEDTWHINKKRPIVDYHYLNFPTLLHHGWYMGPISYRGPADKKRPIDETMTFQGSCWMANKEYLMENIYPMDEGKYGSFYHEHLEVGFKYWYSGGTVKVNKSAQYAHLSKRRHHYKKGMFSRRYKKNRHAAHVHNFVIKHWAGNEESGAKRSFEWMVERFWPLPGWPEDWREKLDKILVEVNKLCDKYQKETQNSAN